MANASEKRRATTNEAALKSLRVGLLLVNILTIFFRMTLSFLLSRPLFASKKIIFLHTATFVTTLFIWRWFTLIGTPKKTAGGSIRAGDDLNAKGVIELSWDFVYITWVCFLLSALMGDWIWWLITLVPIFGGWKLFTLARPLLAMFLPGIFGQKQPGTATPDATANQTEEKGESKKQQKLRARMEKGDKRVQQVQRR